jgi:hypothetical protein
VYRLLSPRRPFPLYVPAPTTIFLCRRSTEWSLLFVFHGGGEEDHAKQQCMHARPVHVVRIYRSHAPALQGPYACMHETDRDRERDGARSKGVHVPNCTRTAWVGRHGYIYTGARQICIYMCALKWGGKTTGTCTYVIDVLRRCMHALRACAHSSYFIWAAHDDDVDRDYIYK